MVSFLFFENYVKADREFVLISKFLIKRKGTFDSTGFKINIFDNEWGYFLL